MLGLKLATKGLGGDAILKKAVSELTKKGVTKEVAEQTVAQASRRQIAEFTGAAAEHAKKQIAAKQLGKNLGKAVGVGGVGEGLTEVAQESIGYLAAVNGSEKQFDWEDYNNRIISAAIAGGSLGGAISSGGTFADAGKWADVAYRLAPADAAKAADSEHFIAREKANNNGRVRSVEEIAADASNRAAQAPGLTIDDRVELYKNERKKKSTFDKVTEEALNVSQLWQGATRNIFTPELKRRSRAATALADMFGGSLDKTHSGSSFENSKHHRVSVYKNMVPDPRAFYQSVSGQMNTKRSKKAEISDNFYNAMQKAVDKEGNFSPDLVPEGKQKQAIIQMATQMNALSDRMYADQKKHNPELGYVKNYLSKYKSINKGALNKNKSGFIQALEKNGYKRDEAHKLLDTILENDQVADIGEAFSVVKGGIDPQSHQSRNLNMSEKAEFQEFMEKDMFANVANATKSAARYTAHRDYIGKNGAVVSKLLDDMQAEGVPQAEVDKIASQMKDYLDAESGNYKRPTSDTGKAAQKFQKNFMMLSTLSALPLATVSSLVETMLINRGLRADQIFGKNGSLQQTGGELANTLWNGMSEITGGVVKEKGLNNRQEILKKHGFYDWDVGAATVTGVSEVNAWQQDFYEGFFKWTGLTGFTNFTRAARAGIAGDYINDKLETVFQDRYSGADRTRETQEAQEQLRNLGIDVDQMTDVYEKTMGGIPLTEAEQKFKENTLHEATFNFVNEAIVLPQAANRPLIYQDPRFALFTQFQGFIATFTANQIPKLWDEYVKRGTPAMKYNAFALASTMIMMGFVSQHLKDLIKYGGKTPHLEGADYIQRGVRGSGLLGTSERILDQFFPLYEKNSQGKSEWAFNQVAGESAAISYGEKLAKAAGSILSGDKEKAVYQGLRAAPVLGPLTNFDKTLASGLTGGGWNFKGE